MAYSKKTWADRVSTYPNRRTLTETATEGVYDITRNEGTVSVQGDKIDASNMNDLENRISTAFNALGTQVTYRLDGNTLYITTK